MKKFEAFWQKNVAEHPVFSNQETKIKMTVGDFKAALETAFHAGAEPLPGDFFDSIFTRKKR